MKQLLILGAGGMGKELFYIAQHSIGYGTEFVIKGYLDYPNPSWNTEIYPPILGIEDDYLIQPNDVFTCSIGDVHLKKIVCEKMKARGAKFQTLIFNNVQIRENVVIGEGTVIDSYAHIGSDVVIGENCLIQAFASVAHDCIIGDYSRIDVRCLLVGGVVVGNSVTIHSNAIISHHVVVEDNATVAALSFVIRKVKKGATVLGNPAILFKYK